MLRRLSGSMKKLDVSAEYGDGFNTLGLHEGHKLDTDNRARAPPIYMSTSFAFKSAEHGAKLFGLAELGPIYTRIMNPTNHVFEYRVARLEGAKCPLHGNFDNAATLPSALAVASGQSAQMQAMLTFMQSGDNFICASELYGGSYTLFAHSFAQMGITAKLFDVTKPEEIAPLIDENTKAIYFETISNPSYNVPDFDAIAQIAQENSLVVVVDNTFGMCGYTCRPLRFGANIVVESCTKWIGGHGTAIGGVIVDGSNFNWGVKRADGSLKYPLIAGPQVSYHGGNFAMHPIFGCLKEDGSYDASMANNVFILLARVKVLRDTGGCMSPFNAFQLIQGLETLGLRGKAHNENANKLAEWLEKRDEVAWVSHPSLSSHPSHGRCKKFFRPGTYGSVMSFGLKPAGGDDARAIASKFISNVKLSSHLANVGDGKTLVIHPSTTTHQQLSEAEQIAAGVRPDMIRVSVGYEDFGDIVDDFKQAAGWA